ncbi:MAG: hypothetical protein ABIO40_05740 [Devosia sp.]
MKIRSLLLGSVAALGFSAGAFATDLGVETDFDICGDLGLSGLMISSDNNCLVITGEVKYEYNWGDYLVGAPPGAVKLPIWGLFDFDNSTYGVNAADGTNDSASLLDWWLQFTATGSSSFGPTKATIKLEDSSNMTNGVKVSQAFVSIGDTTMLIAGMTDSIFNNKDDEPLNFLGLFNSDLIDKGVGAHSTDGFSGGRVMIETGGHVIQVVHDLGNGLSIAGGLENLNNLVGDFTGVGVLAYKSDTISAHISVAADHNEPSPSPFDDWVVHSGFTGTFDTVKVVGAAAVNSDGFWNVLGSASVGWDMITLAVSGEATNFERGFGASIAAAVTDGVSISVGGRVFQDGGGQLAQVAGQIVASVTDEVKLTGEVGAISSTFAPTVGYAKGMVEWAPGGGFTASIAGEVNNYGAYKATFKAAKKID